MDPIESILGRLDRESYVLPDDDVPESIKSLLIQMRAPARFVAEEVRVAAGVIAGRRGFSSDPTENQAWLLTFLASLENHPLVKNHGVAIQLAFALRQTAESLKPDARRRHKAAAERHLGVAAFLEGRPADATFHFTAALEYEATPQNLANVLAAVIPVSGAERAKTLLELAAQRLPDIVKRVQAQHIDVDPDLASLRGFDPFKNRNAGGGKRCKPDPEPALIAALMNREENA